MRSLAAPLRGFSRFLVVVAAAWGQAILPAALAEFYVGSPGAARS